jgi:hypothetical protein
MKRQAGIWIDHKEAVLVFVDERVEGIKDPIDTETTQHVKSSVDRNDRFTGHAASADDQRDRQYAAHIETWFDELIEKLSTAKAILVLGPGEARIEFRKRLEAKGLGDRIVGVEAVDKMSDEQILARVRKQFEKQK